MGNTMRPIENMQDVKRLQYYFNCRNPRDKMLFQLMLQTGYRVGDMVGLLVGEVKEAIDVRYFNIRENKIVNMKKNYCRKKGIAFTETDVVPRKVPIPLDFAKELKKYIGNKKDNEYMFPSRNSGYHISEDRFGKILSEAGRECGIKENICNHTLRKTYALNIQGITRDISKTQMMLAHSTPEATEKYLGIDMIMFKNTMEELAKTYK